jgi:hypothetical protein
MLRAIGFALEMRLLIVLELNKLKGGVMETQAMTIIG